MKDTVRILMLAMLTILFIGCSKNKSTTFNNPQYFTDELKEQYIGILKEYQLNAEQLERLKQYQSQSEVDVEVKNNIVLVDSVVNKSVKLINENQFNELMILLDDNKISFYTHPNNNALWLMGEFNSMMDILYKEYLPREEGLSKAIIIHELRKLSLEGVIGFDGANYRENKQVYDSVYIEELIYMVDIYNLAGGHENEIKEIEAELIILQKN